MPTAALIRSPDNSTPGTKTQVLANPTAIFLYSVPLFFSAINAVSVVVGRYVAGVAVIRVKGAHTLVG